MSPDERHVVLDKPLCLEEGQKYEITLTFDQYDVNNPEPKASILIDSVRNPTQPKERAVTIAAKFVLYILQYLSI